MVGWEKYYTWEDASANTKRWSELTSDQKRRELLFSLAKVDEISDEQLLLIMKKLVIDSYLNTFRI